MVKKKFSGQTIAIIILAILLILAISFGGVYAFYSARTNKVSGKIVMANLKISLVSGTDDSDKSEIVISNGVNVVPGQPLENSPLIVQNLSSVSIYLIVVYEINAITESKEQVVDEYKNPVLGLGVEYINPLDSVFGKNYSSNKFVSNTDWIDYVFVADDDDNNASNVVIDKDANETCKAYRCLVSTVSFTPTAAAEKGITVIGENKLSLAGQMGNEYQGASISFTFQAYAIGAATDFGFVSNETTQGKCEKIVEAIYAGQERHFLNIETTK